MALGRGFPGAQRLRAAYALQRISAEHQWLTKAEKTKRIQQSTSSIARLLNTNVIGGDRA